MEEWVEGWLGLSGSGVMLGVVAGIFLARNGRSLLRAGLRSWRAARSGVGRLADLAWQEAARLEAEAPLSAAPERASRRGGSRLPVEVPSSAAQPTGSQPSDPG